MRRVWGTSVLLALLLLVAACGGSGGDADAGGSGSDGDAEVGGSENESPATDAETTTTFPEVESAEEEADEEFLALDLQGRIDAFLETSNTANGAAVAEAMGRSGDPRWGPWLLDLYRLGRSTKIDGATTEAFQELSGIEIVGYRTDDYRNYGNWVYNEAVDPGPGYREWKLALYGGIDDEFEPLLAATSDDLLLARIQWGGVARGGIPELNDPERVPAAQADWMVPDEVVLGTVVDGVAVAYPLRILAHHELANDTIADRPVSMVYCTLCRSAVLFDRRVDGEVLDFQTSGLLIQSNKIMVDVQTDTLWRHQTGLGIVGEHEGVELAQYPVTTVAWADWIAEHPNSEVLTIPEPIFFDDPLRPPIAYPYEPGEAYRFYYEDPDVWFPVLDTPDVFDLKEQVIGLSSDVRAVSAGDGVDTSASDGEAAAGGGDETTYLAVRLATLAEDGGQVFAVGDRLFAVVPTEGGARAYDLTGSAAEAGIVAGPLADGYDAGTEVITLADGTIGERIIVEQLFWFAWFGDHPTTEWWPADQS